MGFVNNQSVTKYQKSEKKTFGAIEFFPKKSHKVSKKIEVENTEIDKRDS